MARSAALALLILALLAPAAAADIALGVAGRADTGAFVQAHGRQPAVFQTFVMFGGPIDYAFERADRVGAAPMLHISTAHGPAARERVSPKGIARGAMDGWLAGLQARAAAQGGPVYVRPMG